jgi:hypothetical protein
MAVLWNMTSCSLVDNNYLEEPTSTKIHSVTTQKAGTLITTAVYSREQI